MTKKIVMAGGCFWGVEGYFAQLKGVVDTEVGYAQGHVVTAPTYEEVCTGTTGCTEAVSVVYDTEYISLEELLEHMFRFIDPTSKNRQGNDVGSQYRTGIYFEDADEQQVIGAFLTKMQVHFKAPLVVENEKLEHFWTAETYHQAYLAKNPQGYCHINLNLVKDSERK